MLARFHRRAATGLTMCLSLAVLTLLAVPALAAAGPLEDLRKSGAVGERFDGYVVIRDKEPSTELKQAVDEINQKRKAIYEKRAAEEGVPVEQVGRVYASKIVAEAPAGTWFLGEDEVWKQKE